MKKKTLNWLSEYGIILIFLFIDFLLILMNTISTPMNGRELSLRLVLSIIFLVITTLIMSIFSDDDTLIGKILYYLGSFLTIILFLTTLHSQHSFSKEYHRELTTTTHTYPVESIKVVKDSLEDDKFKITYKKDGKLHSVTITDEEAEDYQDYNRDKPNYKLEVKEYSFTKKFKEKYPEFEEPKSDYKLVLERK
ncbi:MAG: hypothetical protein D8H99_57160 [Streptococcus sp.]|nr:MAG: hypothetical protein D8H99_57160 [Streptococcus sp.]